MRKIPNCSKT